MPIDCAIEQISAFTTATKCRTTTIDCQADKMLKRRGLLSSFCFELVLPLDRQLQLMPRQDIIVRGNNQLASQLVRYAVLNGTNHWMASCILLARVAFAQQMDYYQIAPANQNAIEQYCAVLQLKAVLMIMVKWNVDKTYRKDDVAGKPGAAS